jgi:hypothetical protein
VNAPTQGFGPKSTDRIGSVGERVVTGLIHAAAMAKQPNAGRNAQSSARYAKQGRQQAEPQCRIQSVAERTMTVRPRP